MTLNPAIVHAEANKQPFTLTALASSPQWYALNYYHQGIEGYYSEIANSDFFVSDDGAVNPYGELVAFRALMTAYQKEGSHTALLCRFPARMTWLQQTDSVFAKFKRPDCTDYNTINRPEAITSVSLIFASGYFDNPSSFYGHTMLKFNYGQGTIDQATLDASLNYGANNTDSPSNPLYVIRGIFGGYNASYQRNNEFLNSHLYTNVQVRDLWEYELALTPEQRRFMVEHSWEMMRAQFGYFFFNDNCAHRIARIIEEATGTSLSDTSGFWLIPTQVVRHLKPKHGKNLIAKEIYHPSLKTKFSQYFLSLTKDEQNAVIHFLESTPDEQKQAAPQTDSKLLAVSLEHLDLELAKLTQSPKNVAKVQEIHRQRAILLSEILHRPSSTLPEMPLNLTFHSIADMRPPSSLWIDQGYGLDSNFSRLSYRIANNDLLDTPISGQEISQFIMGGAQLERRDGDIKLRKLVLVDILNLNTNPLPMHLTNEFSWGLKLDYSPRNEFCLDCRSAGVEGKVGKAISLNSNMLFYGLGGGRIHSQEDDTESFANLLVEVGSVATITNRLKVHVAIQYSHDVADNFDDTILLLEARHRLTDSMDLRFNGAADDSRSQVSAGVGWYFD